MIEIGKQYRLVMLELCDQGYDQGSIVVTVTGRDGNLLQINGSKIINMASPLFHSLTDEEGERAYFQGLKEKFEAGLDSQNDFT